MAFCFCSLYVHASTALPGYFKFLNLLKVKLWNRAGTKQIWRRPFPHTLEVLHRFSEGVCGGRKFLNVRFRFRSLFSYYTGGVTVGGSVLEGMAVIFHLAFCSYDQLPSYIKRKKNETSRMMLSYFSRSGTCTHNPQGIHLSLTQLM